MRLRSKSTHTDRKQFLIPMSLQEVRDHQDSTSLGTQVCGYETTEDAEVHRGGSLAVRLIHY
jgi:hypothetical protein